MGRSGFGSVGGGGGYSTTIDPPTRLQSPGQRAAKARQEGQPSAGGAELQHAWQRKQIEQIFGEPLSVAQQSTWARLRYLQQTGQPIKTSAINRATLRSLRKKGYITTDKQGGIVVKPLIPTMKYAPPTSRRGRAKAKMKELAYYGRSRPRGQEPIKLRDILKGLPIRQR